jgi:hypothetical protein
MLNLIRRARRHVILQIAGLAVVAGAIATSNVMIGAVILGVGLVVFGLSDELAR